MKAITVLIVTLVSVLAVGCASSKIRLYDGPERPFQEIALIKCDPDIIVRVFDGKEVRNVKGCEISLRPGSIMFDVCFEKVVSSQRIYCTQYIPQTLKVEAGKIYRVSYMSGQGTWRPYISEVTEKERYK